MYRQARRELIRAIRIAQFETRDHVLSRFRAAKPRVINMMANDVCNSRCVMCNIWQQKREYEISPEELRGVLSDPLFSKVRGVGITGGEPTLRPDLPDLFEACCVSLPALRNLSSITNAIRQDQVIERLEACIEVSNRHEKAFSLMVSLDGYGDVHDEHRRKPGNFASATAVIDHFKHRNDVSLLIGCTITNQNVWHVDELLDWMIEEGIYGRFRIAEFINRLYNDDLGSHIRNFSEDEIYHLTGFFKKLELSYEKQELFRDTYRNIQGMLQGEPRSASCPYQTDGVVLDSTGGVLYCAPKSRLLGDATKVSASKLYRDQIDERKRIRSDDCASCIHDYHAPPTASAQTNRYVEIAWKLALRLPMARLTAAATRLVRRRKSKRTNIVITGWYGTETVGDKAILAEIIEHYRAAHGPDVSVTVSSIHPFVTRRTLRELGMSANIVRSYSGEFVAACASADEVVLGGGPIMGIPDLGLPLAAFRIAKLKGARRVIYGSGLGPLDDGRHLRAAAAILKLADTVSLRDEASVRWAEQLADRKDIVRIDDPAHTYVARHFPTGLAVNSQATGTLACFLRSWSAEYRGDRTVEEFEELREDFEERLAHSIRALCERTGWTPIFYSMHTFAVGGDDRDFNRRFVRDHRLEDLGPRVEHMPSSVAQIVDAMRQADHCVCMRFHSVVFAEALNRPFTAFDYTGGGKIRGFLDDRGKLASLRTPEQLVNTPHVDPFAEVV